MKFTLERVREFFAHTGAVKLLLPLIIGVLLIVFSGIGSSEKPIATEEERTAELCSLVDGVGDCRVMITYRETEGEEQVYAVAVLCDGAESVQVRSELTELICSLYGIGANRVKVLHLNE